VRFRAFTVDLSYFKKMLRSVNTLKSAAASAVWKIASENEKL
jgi:hypothetical protein